jgi:hypothetical protein
MAPLMIIQRSSGVLWNATSSLVSGRDIMSAGVGLKSRFEVWIEVGVEDRGRTLQVRPVS